MVVAAGEGIALNRQHIAMAAWFGLLIIPPIMAAGALVVLPWLNVDLRVTQPGEAMARFFRTVSNGAPASRWQSSAAMRAPRHSLRLQHRTVRACSSIPRPSIRHG